VLVLAAAAGSQFASAMRVVLLLVIPLTSLQIVFSPVISRMYAAGKTQTLERLLRSASTATFGLTALLLLPMILTPELVLGTVFGEEFRGAALALTIVSLGMAAQVCCGMCAPALAMTSEEGIVARVHMTAVVARVVLCTAGALVGGMLGLAVCSAVVTAAVFATLWWQARRRLGIWTHPTLRPDLRLILRTPG
ncbi:MAG: lipopolysaccharide biosynthesis protein, partial [Stackebrandtia sp.]